MGVYVGYVEKKGTEYPPFYNFKPVAELKGTKVEILSDEDLSQLLPKSDRANINFYFNRADEDDRDWMEDKFLDESLIIFEFVLDDLEDNFNYSTGERNLTGYKVPAKKYWDMGKIRPIDKDNIYYVLKDENIKSDFLKGSGVEIEASFITEGAYVCVQRDDIMAGPYKVIGDRSRLTFSYIIQPNIKDNKYTIEGYSLEEVNTYTLDNSGDARNGVPTISWPILIPKENAKRIQKDVIDDETLFESFHESINDSDIKDGKVQLDDVQNLLERYNKSALSGSILSEEICQERLGRLFSILTADKDVDYTLDKITGFICDLLIRYKDDEKVNEWLNELFNEHPEMLNQLKDVQAISDRIESIQQDLTDLETAYQQKQEELEDATQKVKDEEDHYYEEVIAKKGEELQDINEEIQNAQQQLSELKKRLQICDDFDQLQGQLDELQSEVEYLQKHKNHLENDTSELELEFQEFVSKQQEKMVDIAFDGFMSSKMLNAAAEWETQESSKQHEELVCAINNINVPHMDSDELVDYICRTVQIYRPTYTKNTIINIMTCISQGFLTVFSGEPGSGKTSICNIIGDVLGLNKISSEIDISEELKNEFNRYVPVSVERGWTSKRDFIGYYNPLSKAFDKSNKRVYEALHQLDTEKQKGFSKFPYIILLDESNLSPMEYYWSDFMNVCDDLGPQSKVNLGENYMFGIPETLHFVATINNDHTTETLSPRLIDRAWIITLPKQNGEVMPKQEYENEQIKIVDWDSIKETFVPSEERHVFSLSIQKVYENILAHLKKERITVSSRVEIAITKYWAVTSKLYEKDEMGTDSSTIALDYAIVQKILPKINGSGEDFGKWLDDFRVLCRNNGLNISAEVLSDIIERGNQQMQYYNFFA